MKFFLSSLLLAITTCEAFTVMSPNTSSQTALHQYNKGNFDLSGNTWKPQSEGMGSTDTGDYFPEDYDPNNNPSFAEGMMGSQAILSGDRKAIQLPGMENLGEDAIMMGGIEENSEIPAGMQFIPSSVPDGKFTLQVAGNSKGALLDIPIKPFCMSFEDYYASFSPDSHPSFTVSPVAGRMDRRGGEITVLTVKCVPKGQSGTFVGKLVVNLPEDNSKLTYEITATVF